MEGSHWVKTGDLLSFSEQQLVDCAYESYGNEGCHGGLQDYAYKYYEDGFKAEDESIYKYISGTRDQQHPCQYNEKSTTGIEVSDFTAVAHSDKDQMKAALTQQPLAVSVEASSYSFRLYHSGVLDDTGCGNELDHAVLAVGYGTDADSGLDYWLVKNSWDVTWGDKGYIKMAIVDGDGICGV